MNGDALTAAQVARMVGVHPAVIYKLVRAGQIGHYRVGGAVRFPREAVDEFLRRIYRPANQEVK